MFLALLGSRGLFSQMQESLSHINGKRVTLTQGVHEALADSQWLAEDMASRPTRLFKLVPLSPTLDGYHDSSGIMCGEVVLPGPSAVPRVLQKQPSAALPSKDKLAAHPIVWHVSYPQDVVDRLVTYKNPRGDINNLGLELARDVFQHCCAADSYDVRERAVLSHTNNSAGMWWMRKGSATFTFPPAHLLRLQAFHQRHHRYVPRHEFVSGVDNDISDVPPRSSALLYNQLIGFLNPHFLQSLSWRMWIPPP